MTTGYWSGTGFAESYPVVGFPLLAFGLSGVVALVILQRLLATSVVFTFVHGISGGQLLPLELLHASLNESAKALEAIGLDVADIRTVVLRVTLILMACAAVTQAVGSMDGRGSDRNDASLSRGAR